MAEQKVSFVDAPHAPDVFADTATGFFLFNGNMRVTFVSSRVNHETTPGPVNNVVIGRLVMPVAQAEAMAKSILDLIERNKTPQEPHGAQSKPTLQ